MTPDTTMLSVVLTIAAVTFALRAAPFLAMERIEHSAFLRYLGARMPVGVMVILVAFTVKDESLIRYPYGLPHVLPAALTVLLYLKLRNPLVAILAGLVLHMVIVNVVL
jgi:branched-subunit amino acid transport protein AzlD